IQSSITKLGRSFCGYWAGPTRPTHHNILLPPGEADGWPTRLEDATRRFLERISRAIASDGRGGECVPVHGPGLCAIARDPALSASVRGSEKSGCATRRTRAVERARQEFESTGSSGSPTVSRTLERRRSE